MADQKGRLKLGAFVLTSLVVLGGLIIAFGRTPTIFTARSRFTLTFSETPGVVVGTPIRKSGVRIGEVADLELDPNTGQVSVHALIESKYAPRRNEDAVITRGLLSGDTTIDFMPRINADGQPEPLGSPYEPGSTIVGSPPVTARSLLAQAQGILPSTQQSLDRIVAAFEKLERLGPKIERALDTIGEFAQETRDFIPELRKTNRQIQELIGSNDADMNAVVANAPVVPGVVVPGQLLPPEARRADPTIRALIADARQALRTLQPAIEDIRDALKRNEPEFQATMKSARATLDSARNVFDSVMEVLTPENRSQFTELLKNVVALSGNLVKLSSAVGGLIDEGEKTIRAMTERVQQAEAIFNDVRAFTKPLGERSERIIANVDNFIDQLAKGLTDLRALTGGLGQGGGSLAKFFSDPMLYHNLNDAALSLSRVMVRVERIAKDLEVFADKIARKPESLGVGGALRPNSGLKDIPGAPLPSYRPDWPPAMPASPSYRYPTLLPPVERP